MRIVSLQVDGLAHTPSLRLEAEDAWIVPSDPKAAVAAVDGLSVLLAALSRPHERSLHERLGRLDLGAWTLDEGDAIGLSGLDPAAVASLLAEDVPRALRVTLALQPDPPLFRRLRELAERDALLAEGLSDGVLTVSAGLLITPSGTGGSVSLLRVEVGDVRLPGSGPDRPRWLSALGEALAARLGLVSDQDEATLARAWQDAWQSPDPAMRARARHGAAELASPPFSLGVLEPVRVGDRLRLALGPDLLPLRAFGPDARLAAALVLAARVHAPDLLALDRVLPTPWLDWLVGCTEGDDATLVQILAPTSPPA